MKQPDHDRFQLWLTDHLARCLGTAAIAHISVTFEHVGVHAVCRVDVAPAPDPVFLDEPANGAPTSGSAPATPPASS